MSISLLLYEGLLDLVLRAIVKCMDGFRSIPCKVLSCRGEKELSDFNDGPDYDAPISLAFCLSSRPNRRSSSM